MRRLLLCGLAFGLLGLAPVAPASSPTAAQIRSAWHDACAVSGYSCWHLARPGVAEAPLTGLYGRYRMGDSYVVILEGLTPQAAHVVMVHEMTHYLQLRHGKWDFTAEGSCAAEKEAFKVSSAVARRIGLKAMIVDWEEARLAYRCAR